MSSGPELSQVAVDPEIVKVLVEATLWLLVVIVSLPPFLLER